MTDEERKGVAKLAEITSHVAEWLSAYQDSDGDWQKDRKLSRLAIEAAAIAAQFQPQTKEPTD